MSFLSQTRADPRALTGAALIGAAVGLILGGVFMAGGLARTASQHAEHKRLAAAAAEGFSEQALRIGALGLDTGVQAVALRHDPAAFSGRLSTADLNNARLQQEMLLRPALGGPFSAAAPFNLSTAADAAREMQCLTQAVYYEARGESAGGQAAVAQVVLNRVRHPAFPKTICAVVFQRGGGVCQFSFACDGSMRARLDSGAWERARKVAARALDGAVASQVGAATHFHTVAVSPGWGGGMMRVAQVGLHVFYRFGAPRHMARPAAPPQAEPSVVAPASPVTLVSLTTPATPAAAAPPRPALSASALDAASPAAKLQPVAAARLVEAAPVRAAVAS